MIREKQIIQESLQDQYAIIKESDIEDEVSEEYDQLIKEKYNKDMQYLTKI